MLKVKMIYHLINILKIKESYDLIGWEHLKFQKNPAKLVFALLLSDIGQMKNFQIMIEFWEKL